MTTVAIIVTIIIATICICATLNKKSKEIHWYIEYFIGTELAIYDAISGKNTPKRKKTTKKDKVSETDIVEPNLTEKTPKTEKKEEEKC